MWQQKRFEKKKIKNGLNPFIPIFLILESIPFDVVGHSPVFQILLQIEVRISIITSPPAWTNSAVMLSTPADFPIFSTLTATSTSSCLHLISVGTRVLLGPHQSHCCKSLNSTLFNYQGFHSPL